MIFESSHLTSSTILFILLVSLLLRSLAKNSLLYANFFKRTTCSLLSSLFYVCDVFDILCLQKILHHSSLFLFIYTISGALLLSDFWFFIISVRKTKWKFFNYISKHGFIIIFHFWIVIKFQLKIRDNIDQVRSYL